MTQSMNGMFENHGAGKALDLDGATVDGGSQVAADEVDPTADFDATRRDSDGTPVGLADVEADAAPNSPAAAPALRRRRGAGGMSEAGDLGVFRPARTPAPTGRRAGRAPGPRSR